VLCSVFAGWKMIGESKVVSVLNYFSATHGGVVV
jgi:hypothetical protein